MFVSNRRRWRSSVARLQRSVTSAGRVVADVNEGMVSGKREKADGDGILAAALDEGRETEAKRASSDCCRRHNK